MIKYLAILLLLVGCDKAPEIQFKTGDCIDRSDWVMDNHELNGNMYKEVVGLSYKKDYLLVKECLLMNGEGSIKICEFSDPLSARDLENYTKINCPK